MSGGRNFSAWALAGLRVVLGGVLFYAGFLKIQTPAAFAETIANYNLLPAVANQFLAVTLPWCEVFAGLLLVFGVWTSAAGLVAALLFATFTGGVVSALARGLDISCGCFGTAAASRIGIQTLLIDGAGLAVALLITVKNPSAAERRNIVAHGVSHGNEARKIGEAP